MIKKIFAVMAILMILGVPVFAGGAAETVAGTLGGTGAGASTGAGIGAVIGTIFGPVGSAVGAAIGAGIGGLVGGVAGGLSGAAKDQQRKAQQEQIDLQKEKNYQDAYLNAKGTYDSAYSNYENSLAAIQQGQANISSYDQAIMRWQDQYNIQNQQLQAQGKVDYLNVMNNYAGTANAQAAMGQSGGTADILAGNQRSQVVSLVGDDLRLDAQGGTYGSAIREFELDSDAEFSQMVDQRQIEIEALNKNIEASNEYANALKNADANLQVASSDYFNGGFSSANKIKDTSGYDNDVTQSQKDLVTDIKNGDKTTDAYTADSSVDDQIAEIEKKRKKTNG